MVVDEIRRAIEAAPRMQLAKIGEALWKAWGQGLLGDEEAQALSDLIETRRALPAPAKAAQRRTGARPRSAASLERRRSWAASGRLPPALAARFTLAEQAVLAVLAVEVTKHGACTLVLDQLAALAGVCRSSARNALRQARALGLILIKERRLSAWRSLPNLITILSPEWLTWMRLKRGGGGKCLATTNTHLHKSRTLPSRASPSSQGKDVLAPTYQPLRKGNQGAFGDAGALPAPTLVINELLTTQVYL
jgi:hypothetical protein